MLEGYRGRLCAQCAAGYFRRRRVCVKCGPPGETQLLFVGLACFIVFLDLVLIFAHLDLANSFCDVIGTAQMFRAIGLMGAAALPEMVQNFYFKLGLVTFDFEFVQPGCGAGEEEPPGYEVISWAKASAASFLLSARLL